jgi:hypothetical protein
MIRLIRLVRTPAGLAAAATLAACALPAVAQVAGPGAPAAEVPLPVAHATSSLEVTAATPAEQRETRLLATAVFTTPAAAAHAAEKAAAAIQPDLTPAVHLKPEWSAGKRPLVGGRGMKLTAPF